MDFLGLLSLRTTQRFERYRDSTCFKEKPKLNHTTVEITSTIYEKQIKRLRNIKHYTTSIKKV